MNKDLDEQCAVLLGWHKGMGGAIGGIAGYEWPAYWYDADGKQCRPRVTDAFANLYAFSPTSNDADAKLLEDMIEQQWRRVPEYMAALERIINSDTLTYSGRFALIRATPDQRTRAFVAVFARDTQ